MRIYLSFTIAASKMFFRRKSSIFWSLFFPVVTMLVLGNAGFIGYSAPNVGLFSTTANEIIDELKSSKSITIREYQSKDNALEALEKGTLSALITLNPDSKFIVTTRDGDLAEKEVVENFVFRIINQDISPINNVSSDIAKMNYQGYKGFIFPGIAAMAIMQNGIFSVVFTLLSYKNQGVLKLSLIHI